jgi:cytochrome c oxidase cbb3-type subunit 3
MTEKKIDEVTGVSTTGHEWDGIRELDNPMPRWWVYTFYATIVWTIGYTILFPAWPMLSSATSGVLGYSSRADVKTELAAADAAKSGYIAEIGAKSVGEILADDKLRSFALAAGAAKFKVNCVQCHGSGAEGSKGFPNLNDDDWLWGGKPEDIELTIAHGARFAADDKTRISEMPAFKDILQPAEISAVANFTAGLAGMPVNAELAQSGQAVFAQNCVACHGEAGKGNRELGAPNLTDAISLYVHSVQDIASQVSAPKHGAMPGWSARLGDVSVKELTVYVHSLGGGE